MRRVMVVLMALLVGACSSATAGQAACLAPIEAGPATPRFYLDAVRGNDAADGRSPATAWRSFAAVLRKGRLNPAISHGAQIVLANGEYGPLAIPNLRSPLPPRRDGKAAYLSFVAAPGARPVLASLAIAGSERLLFSGISFRSQSGFARFRPLVRIIGNADAPSRNIRIIGNEISSAADYRSWSQDDWTDRVAWAGIAVTGNPVASVSCVVVERNHIHGVGGGVMLFAEDSRLVANHIHDFALDGIDIAGNRLDIVGNRVTDNLALPLGFHNDLIQGQRGPAIPGPDGKLFIPRSTWSDVHIIGNVLVRQSRPDLRLAGGTQGITGFADVWERLVVANNVVVIGGPRRMDEPVFFNNSGRGELPFSLFQPCTADRAWRRGQADPGINAENVRSVPAERLGANSACGTHALTFGTVRHGAIVHNTLMTDNPAMAMAGVWIMPGREGGETCDTIVANNLGNWANLSALKGTLVGTAPASAGERSAACTPGRIRNYAAGNLELDATRAGGLNPRKVFRRHPGLSAPSAAIWNADLHLAPGSPAIGAGNAAMARAALGPLAATDVDGRPRRKSDIGAYAF